jgi:hypothetical protein
MHLFAVTFHVKFQGFCFYRDYVRIMCSFIGMAIRYGYPIPAGYLMGTDMGTIFYPWVSPVPDPNRDGYETCIFFYLRVTRRVPDTILSL